MRKVLAVLAVAALLFSAVAAQHMMRGPKGRMGKGPGCFQVEKLLSQGKEELGLSDEQVAKIKSLWKDHRKSMIKSEADLELVQLDLQEAMDQDKIDKVKVDALCDKVTALEGQARKSRMGLMADVSNVLTKEQRAKAKSLRGKMERGDKGCPMEKGKGAGEWKGHERALEKE